MTTIRTIKLKRNVEGSGTLSSPVTPEGAPSLDAEPLTASHASPIPESVVTAPKTVSSKHTVWFMLITLFAVIGMIVILGLQYSEMAFFKQDPSVWLPGK